MIAYMGRCLELFGKFFEINDSYALHKQKIFLEIIRDISGLKFAVLSTFIHSGY